MIPTENSTTARCPAKRLQGLCGLGSAIDLRNARLVQVAAAVTTIQRDGDWRSPFHQGVRLIRPGRSPFSRVSHTAGPAAWPWCPRPPGSPARKQVRADGGARMATTVSQNSRSKTAAAKQPLDETQTQ